MESCIIIPQIKNKENKSVDSKLYKDLLSYTGSRTSANVLWGAVHTGMFFDNIKESELDENGEPTLKAVDNRINIKEVLNGNISDKAASIEAGATDNKGKVINYNNPEDAFTKAINYNNSSDSYVADVVKDDDTYHIVLKDRQSNPDVSSELVFKRSLSNSLQELVRSLGFSIAIENSRDHNGIYDPLNAETTADNLKTVIRISQGNEGEDALPEEVAHLIVDGLATNPLGTRLLSYVRQEGVIQRVLGDQYEEYYRRYDGDLSRLAREVAGKLLADQIRNNKPVQRMNLVQRLWNRAKNLFSKSSESEIDNAINEANRAAGEIASKVIDKSIIPFINKNNITNQKALFSVAKSLNYTQDLLNRALETEIRKLNIIRRNSKSRSYTKKDADRIRDLQDLIEKKKVTAGCLSFLQDALDNIKNINDHIHKLTEIDLRGDDNVAKLNAIAKVLRDSQQFLFGYKPIITEMLNIDKMQEEEKADITADDAAKVSQKADEVFKLLNSVEKSSSDLRFQTVYNFLKLYWTKDQVINLGNNKTQVLTLQGMLEMAQRDIGFFDRWVSSLADSADPLSSLIDKVVKLQQLKRDNVLNDIINDIRALNRNLIDSGENASFMMERDKDGNLTGRYISDIDFDKYNKERQAYVDKVKEQKTPYYKAKALIEAWEMEHTEAVKVDPLGKSEKVEMLPKASLYHKDVLSKLNTAQKDYYNNMLHLKVLMEDLLPSGYSNTYRAVQIRNNMVQAITDSRNPLEATKQVLGQIRDNFVERTDDTIFGGNNSKNILLDFSGKEVRNIPIYYTHELEDPSRLSTDVTGSMIAYAAMAVNYNEMNKIINLLELTKDIVMDRKVQQLDGGNKLMEEFKILKQKYTKPFTISGSKSAIGARLEHYYDSVLYGKRTLRLPKIQMGDMNLDTTKVAETFKWYTSILGMGFNAFAGISNILGGKLQMIIEAAGGEYFNFKDLVTGGRKFYAMLPSYLSEVNSTSKNNKLALLQEKFDAMDEFYESLSRTSYQKGALKRVLGDGVWFIMNNIGEVYLHNQIMLAMMGHYKVLLNGKKIPLDEAYEIQDIKNDSGKKIGSKLVLKKGVTKLDGNEFTEKDVNEFKLVMKRVQAGMNGAFNEDDRGVLNRYVLGRFVMQFRQWMPAMYGKRFAKGHWDAELQKWVEGYYITMYKFSVDLMKDLTKGQFNLVKEWKNLNPQQKANMRRGIAELTMFTLIALLVKAMGAPGDDKNEGVWYRRMILYNLNRLQLETGAMIPNADLVHNFTQIAQNPAAAVNSLDNLTNLIQIGNMFDEIQSGRYKGWSKWERDAIKAIPLYGQAAKLHDIADEDYMFTIFNQ